MNIDNDNFTALCTIVILVYENKVLDFWKRNKYKFDILVLFLQDVLYSRYISEECAFISKVRAYFFSYSSIPMTHIR